MRRLHRHDEIDISLAGYSTKSIAVRRVHAARGKHSSVIRLATYNIHYAVGRDGRYDLDRVMRAVQGVDVIALQEVDRNWDRSENSDQPTDLKRLSGYDYGAWGPNVDVLKHLPDRTPHGARRQFGNMILSRFPILSIRNYFLPRYGASNLMDMQRGALEVVVDVRGEMFRVYATHLCHLAESQRQVQARQLMEICARAVEEGPLLSGVHPTDPSWSSEPALPDVPRGAIILADLNADPRSGTYAILAGEKSSRFGHMARRDGFFDAWVAAGHDIMGGETRFDSFADKQGRRIDYCFLSNEFAGRVEEARVLTDVDGSDHQPLIVTLRDAQAEDARR
jgi:endonuclease/exonuclease/phosphatase family metal-dependent hydrolase